METMIRDSYGCWQHSDCGSALTGPKPCSCRYYRDDGRPLGHYEDRVRRIPEMDASSTPAGDTRFDPGRRD